MRIRTIVVLVVAGLALLVVPRLGARRPSDPPPPTSAETSPVPTDETPPVEPVAMEPVAEPTTTTTGSTEPPEIEGWGMGDPLGQRWPLIELLPKDAAGWRIDYRVEDERLVLVVSLRAVLNRADQLESYRADSRAYKGQALEWLRSVGADPAGYTIEWRPPETAGF